MAFTTVQEVGKIDISGPYKHISVRIDTVVKEDGQEIARKFHRSTIDPLMDVSAYPEEVRKVAAAVYTDTVKAEYQAHLDSLSQ